MASAGKRARRPNLSLEQILEIRRRIAREEHDEEIAQAVDILPSAVQYYRRVPETVKERRAREEEAGAIDTSRWIEIEAEQRAEMARRLLDGEAVEEVIGGCGVPASSLYRSLTRLQQRKIQDDRLSVEERIGVILLYEEAQWAPRKIAEEFELDYEDVRAFLLKHGARMRKLASVLPAPQPSRKPKARSVWTSEALAELSTQRQDFGLSAKEVGKLNGVSKQLISLVEKRDLNKKDQRSKKARQVTGFTARGAQEYLGLTSCQFATLLRGGGWRQHSLASLIF